MIDVHAQAVLDLLTAAIVSPNKVFDGKVPTGTDPKVNPYVLAYFSGGYPDLAFTGVAFTYQLRATLHCVGGNATAARRVSDLAETALLNVTPTVASRKCFPIRFEEDAQEPLPNEATGSQIVDYVVRYTLRSVPA